MNSKIYRTVILITGLIIGVFIIFLPTILTGSWFLNESYLGGLVTADYVIKVSASAIGLLVIYDAVKFYFR